MGLFYFLIVGLIAGWLAGQFMKGGGYGVIVDIVLGVLGGVMGGWIFGALGIWPGGGSSGRSSSLSLEPWSWSGSRA